MDMKALVFNNEVIQMENSQFPVASEMVWMEAPDNCKTGWILKDGSLVAPPLPVEPTYAEKREWDYPNIGDQLDDLYHKGAFSEKMTAKLKAIKIKYPKD
jgi:hypothetical protein